MTKLLNRVVVAWLLAAGIGAFPSLSYAASFNQNLGLWPADESPISAPSSRVQTQLIVGYPAGALPPPAEPRPQRLAQAKAKAPPPTTAIERAPSGADIVNKLLAPGPSDPNVPMPHPDLAKGDSAASSGPANGPRIFGRGEEGGGVLGFRVPIPADRGGLGVNTRYSSGQSAPESAHGTR